MNAEVGRFLEQKAKLGNPIAYKDVVDAFPGRLPNFSGSWQGHPLSSIFGELDEQDHAANRPWRTALVVSRETGRPGQGFFDTIARLRGIDIAQEDRERIWLTEYKRLVESADGSIA